MSQATRLAFATVKEALDHIAETVKALERSILTIAAYDPQHLLLRAAQQAFAERLDLIQAEARDFWIVLDVISLEIHCRGDWINADISENMLMWIVALSPFIGQPDDLIRMRSPWKAGHIVWSSLRLCADEQEFERHIRALDLTKRILQPVRTFLLQQKATSMDSFDAFKDSLKETQIDQGLPARTSQWPRRGLLRLPLPRITFRDFKYRLFRQETSGNGPPSIDTLQKAFFTTMRADALLAREKLSSLECKWVETIGALRRITPAGSIRDRIIAAGACMDDSLRSVDDRYRIGIILPGDSEIYWHRGTDYLANIDPSVYRNFFNRCFFVKAEVHGDGQLWFRGVRKGVCYGGELQERIQTVRFTVLPAEMRNRIYEYVCLNERNGQASNILSNASNSASSVQRRKHWPQLSLALTCQQVNEELMPIWFRALGWVVKYPKGAQQA